MHEQRQFQESPTLSQGVLGDFDELNEVMQWLALEDYGTLQSSEEFERPGVKRQRGLTSWQQ